MEVSGPINELAAALSKAQGEMKAAAKDSTNPHYKSRYADLASVWEACRGPLSTHGIAVIQGPTTGDGGRVSVTTMLAHSSGQWVKDTVSAPATKFDVQGVGSVITYLKRYALSAMVGIAPEEDDDGNAGVESGSASAGKPARTAPEPTVPANGESKPATVVWFDARWAELEMVMTPAALEAWGKKHKANWEKLRAKSPELADKLTERFNAKWKEPVYAS